MARVPKYHFMKIKWVKHSVYPSVAIIKIYTCEVVHVLTWFWSVFSGNTLDNRLLTGIKCCASYLCDTKVRVSFEVVYILLYIHRLYMFYRFHPRGSWALNSIHLDVTVTANTLYIVFFTQNFLATENHSVARWEGCHGIK